MVYIYLHRVDSSLEPDIVHFLKHQWYVPNPLMIGFLDDQTAGWSLQMAVKSKGILPQNARNDQV